MQHRWIIILLVIIDFGALFLLISPISDLITNGLQSDSAFKVGLIISLTGLLNLQYVRHR
ncbi:hypothetical protein [Periweissella beninensis]|uniref:Uncharacterized protein n=1 Tax=Periweissella beninensis TaxID=504936 RepID=A0ABT0VF55_9LACO|nr:hypothetical protein [Periweissella beninensis]MBM7543494.1 hypothetical protein [Periweissella beninensis]MCM2436476.1 hypothetical protein [Periweissella beninensis]MCT4396194.1 hypothetical protein [Periweissella beninensis]